MISASVVASTLTGSKRPSCRVEGSSGSIVTRGVLIGRDFLRVGLAADGSRSAPLLILILIASDGAVEFEFAGGGSGEEVEMDGMAIGPGEGDL